MTTREPRLERAKKALRPQPAWIATYESYTPSSDPWPMEAIAIVLYGQAIIWAQGGHPNVSVLCQIMAQTDTGIETDIDSNQDEVWEVLNHALLDLPWGTPSSCKQEAFFAAASILADVLRKVDITNLISAQSETTANEVLADLYHAESALEGDGDAEPMMMDGADQALEELRKQLSDDAVSDDDKDAIAEYLDQVENGRPDSDLAEEA